MSVRFNASPATGRLRSMVFSVQGAIASLGATLAAGAVAFGSTIKFAATRHNEEIPRKDGETATFAVSYDAAPEVRVLPQNWQLPGTSSTANRKIEFKATNVTVSTCVVRAKMSTGATQTFNTNDFAATLNGTPQAAGISLSTAGSAAYCNLSGANGVETTYNVFYDVDTTGMGSGKFLYVKAYKNDGVGSTNWTEVGSQTYDIGVNVTGEQINFTATLSQNFDVGLVITYSQSQPPGDGSVTADRVEYYAITTGTEESLTQNTDAALLVQAQEKS